MSGKEKRSFLDERVCPVCKKVFIAAPLHAYKEHGKTGKAKLVCSYACDMQSFRDHQAKLQRKKRSNGNA